MNVIILDTLHIASYAELIGFETSKIHRNGMAKIIKDIFRYFGGDETAKKKPSEKKSARGKTSKKKSTVKNK